MPQRILVVRLGAMGDILHTLPAVASLAAEWPEAEITWLVDPRWLPLLERNSGVRRTISLNRRSAASIFAAIKELRAAGFVFSIDFQGLVKSSLAARLSGAPRRLGFVFSFLREKPAALFYTERVRPSSRHVVDMNLDLAAAAGARRRVVEFALPRGVAEGPLPDRPFVLASPKAGWGSKQWPLERYSGLARRLGEQYRVPLVVNGAPSAEAELRSIEGAHVHISGIPGLIDATRRAMAVVGVDSGPLHLAAALGKPGVAIFGPTDPARNGPYGGSMEVIRASGAETTYQRGPGSAASMREITVDDVVRKLMARVER
jgi:heptosyltransferase-1